MKKNILYIHTHDSGIYFQPYGYNIRTPNLTAFCEDAICFDKVFCCSPTCSPSRSALLSGRYPHTNGMLGLGNRGFEMNNYRQHLVTRLNRENYHTVLCGVQHEYGRYKDHLGGAIKIGYKEDITSDCTAYLDKELVLWDRENTENVCNWIHTYDGDQPFFISMGFFSTHREYPTNAFSNKKLSKMDIPTFLIDTPQIREDWAGHLKSAELFDDNFGKIMQTLKDTNVYDQTLIIFTTDHGIPYPYAKCTLYDAGLQVACIIRDPEAKENGLHYTGLLSQIDIAPTICDLISINKDKGYQGKSFQHVFYDIRASGDEAVFAEINFHTSYEPARCVRTDTYKLICYYDDYKKIHKSNIDNSKSKTYYMKHGLLDIQKPRYALYDLLKDPFETTNLIHNAEYQDIHDELIKKLKKWQHETKDDALPLPQKRWKKEWRVNYSSCIDPKSECEKDFIQ